MNRVCRRCKIERPLDDYRPYNNGKTRGYRKTCKHCQNSLELIRISAPGEKKRRSNYAMLRNQLMTSEQRKTKNARNSAFMRKFSKTNPIRHKSNKLKAAYGITVEQYDEMLSVQGEVCFICRQPNASGRSLAVDHCHSTGKIRKLLCSPCNMAIGMVKEDADRARAIASYIEEFC